MSSRSLSALLFTTLLVGCATDGATNDLTGAGGKADGSQEPQITFKGDWTETVSGELVGGYTVRVSYDLDRLQDCRGESGGSEQWGAAGYASFDGGAPVTFAVSRLDNGTVKPVAAELEIPANAHSVEMWFSSSNRWGCIAYDSNENANYTFDVTPASGGSAVLAFDADGTESQSGDLHVGQQAVVHYEPSRLSQCASSSGGYAKWTVSMHYKVDGGAEKTLLVSQDNGGTLEASDPKLTVPRGHDLEVWFTATSVYGCNEADTNSGGNYHYSIN